MSGSPGATKVSCALESSSSPREFGERVSHNAMARNGSFGSRAAAALAAMVVYVPLRSRRARMRARMRSRMSDARDVEPSSGTLAPTRAASSEPPPRRVRRCASCARKTTTGMVVMMSVRRARRAAASLVRAWRRRWHRRCQMWSREARGAAARCLAGRVAMGTRGDACVRRCVRRARAYGVNAAAIVGEEGGASMCEVSRARMSAFARAGRGRATQRRRDARCARVCGIKRIEIF